MKIGILASLLAAATGLLLIPMGTAEAMMYVDTEERRSALFGAFLLITGMIGGLCLIFAFMARHSNKIEPSLEPSSVVVPPTKQESNIVPHIITA